MDTDQNFSEPLTTLLRKKMDTDPDFSEPLVQLSQYVRQLTDLLNERKYEESLMVALDATTACYKIYDYAKKQVRVRGPVSK